MRAYALLMGALSLVILGCMDCGGGGVPPPVPQPAPVVPGGGGEDPGRSGPGISGTLTLFQSGAQGSGDGTVDVSELPPGMLDAIRAARASSRAREPRERAGAGASRAFGPPTVVAPPEQDDIGVNDTVRTGKAEWVPGEIIVRTEEPLSPSELLRRVRVDGLRVEHVAFVTEHLQLVRYRVLETGEPLDVARTFGLTEVLSAREGIRFTEVNALFQAFARPNDEFYGLQWHYEAMQLPAAWDVTQGASSVVVAVLDTGILPHPDLAGRLLPGADMISDASRAMDGNGRDMDPTDTGRDQPNGGSSWHGLHVAGTIGAASNNGMGVSGVDWAARILPVRVLGRGGGSTADIAAGMAWAYGATVPGVTANANPARVLNLSLGGNFAASPVYQEVIDAGVSRGAVFVIAAGNENENASMTAPCNQNNVICVGSTRISGRRSSFSNYGAVVDVMAPGGEVAEDTNGDDYPDGVLSTTRLPNGNYGYVFEQGTSMAAPHVAGLVALMKARNPALNHAQVESILRSTANAAFTCSQGCGAGLVNAQAAVLAAGGQAPTGPARLSVATSELTLTSSLPEATVQLANLGGAALTVSAAVSGAPADRISFPDGNSVQVAAGQGGALRIRVDLSGLAAGTHQATLSLTSNGGNAQVPVRIRVGATQEKDAAVLAVYLDGEEWKVGGEAWARAAKGHTYDLNTGPGVFFVLAAVDDDGDDEWFEDGERVGFWPTTSAPEFLEVPANTRIVEADFTLVPFKPVGDGGGGDTRSGIGGACGSDAQCQSEDCIDAWPGGYCTQACTQSCPSGSWCYTLTTSSGPVSLCLAACNAPGGGRSTCREGYVCYPDADGDGYCWPRCTSNADCAGSCNTQTGYCQ